MLHLQSSRTASHLHILAAFDKFKNSMSAAEACAAAAAGAREALGEGITVTEAPLTDGGEGFGPILTRAADGHLEYHTVCGPLGADLEAPLGWIDVGKLPPATARRFGMDAGRLAIIEMAAVAGLEQVPAAKRHPKHGTTRGVGELIRIATAEGAAAILLGAGGSATSDLGLGALEALGLNFPDAPRIHPARWDAVRTISGAPKATPPIYIACDVENPLTGPTGAAAIYGPQKGLQPDEIEAFDREVRRLAKLLCAYFERDPSLAEEPGCGAAGGIGFGLKAACGAVFLPGFELVAEWLALDAKIRTADLVLSGEGKIDSSSLSGKGPYTLAGAAEAAGKPTLLFAGSADPGAAARIRELFPRCEVYSITPAGSSLAEALAGGAKNLKATITTTLRPPAANEE